MHSRWPDKVRLALSWVSGWRVAGYRWGSAIKAPKGAWREGGLLRVRRPALAAPRPERRLLLLKHLLPLGQKLLGHLMHGVPPHHQQAVDLRSRGAELRAGQMGWMGWVRFSAAK
jgi:hypothetical protein